MRKYVYSFLFVLCALFTVQAETMVVATFNMRYANKEDSTNGNGWGQRYPYIAQLIQFHGFDIFGTQECLYHQLQDLKRLMPGYDYIGVGREDGKQAGEHAAIFYRTDKFEVKKYGVLTDTYRSEVTGSELKERSGNFPKEVSLSKYAARVPSDHFPVVAIVKVK